MFKVIEIKTGNVCTVYGINGLFFLMYGGIDENGKAKWVWGEMENYFPIPNCANGNLK